MLLDQFYPGKSDQYALNQFRSRVKQAAAESGHSLQLKVDSQKHSLPNQRFCWFAGEDLKKQQFQALNKQNTATLNPDNMINPRGSLHNHYQIFVSFAHADNKWVNDLIERLKKFIYLRNQYTIKFCKF